MHGLIPAIVSLALLGNTSNMGLVTSTPGVTSQYQINVNEQTNWQTIDGHDHSPGHGVAVPVSGLNINAALPFNGYPATELGYAGLVDAGAGPSVLLTIWSDGTDLWYEDGAGNKIRLTCGGAPCWDGGASSFSSLTVTGTTTTGALTMTGSCITLSDGFVICQDGSGGAYLASTDGGIVAVLATSLYLDGGLNVLPYNSDGIAVVPGAAGGGFVTQNLQGPDTAISEWFNAKGSNGYFAFDGGVLVYGLADLGKQWPDYWQIEGGSGSITATAQGSDTSVSMELFSKGAAPISTETPLDVDAGIRVGPFFSGTPVQSIHSANIFLFAGNQQSGVFGSRYGVIQAAACIGPWPTPPCICGNDGPFGSYTCPDGGTDGGVSGIGPGDSCFCDVLTGCTDAGVCVDSTEWLVSVSPRFDVDGGLSSAGNQLMIRTLQATGAESPSTMNADLSCTCVRY